MREHRIFHPQPLQTGAEVTLDDNACRHVVQVLRLRPNEHIVLFDGSGMDYAATLLKISKNTASAKVGQVLRRESPAPFNVHLALGISRGERMDFSVQKAVELGVQQITPLFTGRTLVQLKGAKLQARLAHWQGVIRHACEQSGRASLPTLHTARSLSAFLEPFSGQGILLDHRAALQIHQIPKPDGNLTVLVGPEGGLAQKERDLALQCGFIGVKLGPRILRTETAPLAALAAIQTLWGDFCR